MKNRNPTVWYSIFNFKCPRCRKGNLFPPGSLYRFREFDKMYPACLCCGQMFEPRPGYSFGHIFINYALTAFIFLIMLMSLYYLFQKLTLLLILAAIAVLVLFFTPPIFRLSRSLWLHLFIRYVPGASSKC